MSKSKTRNSDHRKALLERAYLSGLYINRKWNPRIEHVPALTWLWKNQMVKMERIGPVRSKHTRLVPTEKGLKYLGQERLAAAIKRYEANV